MRRLCAVLGREVSRSLSPMLHGAAASALAVDLAYVPINCADEAAFECAVGALLTIGALGANVTIPYKAAAARLADARDPLVERLGVANTLCFDGGASFAQNTDVEGLVRVLGEDPRPDLSEVVLLGAGGAARAAYEALMRRGAKRIVVLARRPEAASFAAEARPFERRSASFVVSALPGDRALAARALAEWIDAPRILDLAYGVGAPSALVAAARAAGLAAEDGLGMLVEQAALSFAAWTGKEVSAVRNAMRDALTAARADSLL